MDRMENIMLYALKRDFDVQKAERFFKERGIKVQAVDMKKHPPGLRELKLFAQRAGLQNIIDKQGKVILATVGYDDEEFDALIRTIEKTLEN